MRTEIKGSPSFAYIEVDLDPGESIIAESDAMASMSGNLDMGAELNGGFFSAIGKKFLGGESLFINRFTNRTSRVKHLTLVQKIPGDIREHQLINQVICFQPGAFIAATSGIKLGVQWAGLASLVGREGLFKLLVSGMGKVWYGAYGGLLDKVVTGQYIVDTGHLVAYQPHMRLKMQLAGGIFASFLGGEGLVTRVEGQGKITIQTRSMKGLRDWLNPKL